MNLRVIPAVQTPVTQAEFALLIGVSEAKVSQLASDGTLEPNGSAHDWLVAYCARLREVAAGRQSEELGGLDLVQERAALAREQRVSYEIRNAVARGQFAPIGVLSETLAAASQSVVDRIDQLPSLLRKACPDLPNEARDQIDAVIAAARNEWIRSTEELVVKRLVDAAAEDEPPAEEEGA